MADQVLMIAEKPSIARSIANALSSSGIKESKGISQICPILEFPGQFFGTQVMFVVTSVCGHVFSTDFKRKIGWDQDPILLYDADTTKVETQMKGGSIVKHLKSLAKRCTYLVLWLDCDREGENICFEVMDVVLPHLRNSRRKQVYRAKFSSLTPNDLRKAIREDNLVDPNENESNSVDARQVLDLKIGVSFTRFQTQFFSEKYGNLDSRLISYGPCQTPTLGFCVARYDEIMSFKPTPYFKVELFLSTSPPVKAKAQVGVMKSQQQANQYLNKINKIRQTEQLQVLQTRRSQKQVKKPEGLNTVSMLKLASQLLGISPQQAMHLAEKLYLSGVITYPRTETTAYAPSFDLRGLIGKFSNDNTYGEFAQSLLSGRFQQPRKGFDAGDHPPITPCKSTSNLDGQSRQIYDLVVRHFLATVSPNCHYEQLEAQLRLENEIFTVQGSVTTDPGFSYATPWAVKSSNSIPNFTNGEIIPIANVNLVTKQTKPPGYLTESDLLGLMEKNGIGTDASMPVHINNICDRNYVKVGPNRTLIPTQLGVTLVHGYYAIDKDLVLPSVRGDIEKSVSYIAKGQATYEDVVEHALRIFKQKFDYFRTNIGDMDILFEASFSPIALSQGKPMTRCGDCNRFMKYLPLRPQRLYCSNCEKTYKLPPQGQIRNLNEKKCPLDGFELVMLVSDKVSYSLCPKCYNDSTKTSALTCANCPKVDCRENLGRNKFALCPKCSGDILLIDVKPKYFILCKDCMLASPLCKGCSKISVTKNQCNGCSGLEIKIEYTKNSPFKETVKEGCLNCDIEIFNQTELAPGQQQQGGRGRPQSARGGRGGRGGRRGGRGGRRGRF